MSLPYMVSRTSRIRENIWLVLEVIFGLFFMKCSNHQGLLPSFVKNNVPYSRVLRHISSEPLGERNMIKMSEYGSYFFRRMLIKRLLPTRNVVIFNRGPNKRLITTLINYYASNRGINVRWVMTPWSAYSYLTFVLWVYSNSYDRRQMGDNWFIIRYIRSIIYNRRL